MKLADEALRSSQTGSDEKKSSKKPPRAQNSFSNKNVKPPSSFTLKNKNMQRMQDLVYGTKRRQSYANENIMNILNSSMKNKKRKEDLRGTFREQNEERLTMQANNAPKATIQHRNSFQPLNNSVRRSKYFF